VWLGAAGYAGLGSFRAHAAEHDLTRIGQGVPVLMQIHDPSCLMCTALQKQARAALKSGETGRRTHLVADIKTDAGAAFELCRGVGHVTVLLLDGQGRVLRVVEGAHSSAELEPMSAADKAANM
jgi:hypothetical protein